MPIAGPSLNLHRSGLAASPFCLLLNGSQKAAKARLKFGIVELALPNDQNSPSIGEKPALIFLVALDVSFKFLSPKCATRFGHIPPAASVPMPKTSMNEYHTPPTSKDDIGSSGQFPLVQPVAVPKLMQHSSEQLFGARVRPPDAPHERGAAVRRHDVDHACLAPRSGSLVNQLTELCLAQPINLPPGCPRRERPHANGTLSHQPEGWDRSTHRSRYFSPCPGGRTNERCGWPVLAWSLLHHDTSRKMCRFATASCKP